MQRRAIWLTPNLGKNHQTIPLSSQYSIKHPISAHGKISPWAGGEELTVNENLRNF